jgi:hypothetical protein
MFVITINNAQRQMVKHVGIYLSLPALTHGKLYVAFSQASCLTMSRLQLSKGINNL